MTVVTVASEILHRLFFCSVFKRLKKSFKVKLIILRRSTFYVIYYTVFLTSVVSETRDVASFELRVKCASNNTNYIYTTFHLAQLRFY